ncbi:MAG TPA: LpqB family beta-propeller domain-containing protein, partial [Actinomycetes bacterium]|nr:LpqB family beta-propeller domain-containing protein [Actinomycetes bacterium]
PGCASMPTSGAVREAAAGNAAEQPGIDSEVRVYASPPRPGMDQTQIVNGFLDAMNSVEPDFAIAKEYLAAPDDWDPSARVRVYDETKREVRTEPSGLRLESFLVGEVRPDGRYLPAQPDSLLTQQFDVTKIGGEWRIDHPPSGVLVANIDFTREYVSTDEPIDLYFFDPSYRVLVPDPIYLPKRADLLTAVTEAVLRGPADRLADAVVSAVPTGTRLASRPVTAVNGQITVRLDRTAAGLDDAERKLLTAQLVWSLSGVSEGAPVVVTVDGVPLYPRPTTTADWELYQPSTPSAEFERFYLLGESGLMTYDPIPGAKPERVSAGAGGDRLERLAAFAVSPSTRDVAGVSQDRTKLFKIRLDPTSERPEPLHSGASALASPSWDRFGGLWVVDQHPAAPRVYFFDDAGKHEVSVDELGDRKITALAVSSDGTRVAMITQLPDEEAQLELGFVKTAPVQPDSPDPRRKVRPVSIVALHELAPQLKPALDVAWVDPQRLVVLIKDAEGELVQPFEVGVDGRTPDPLPPLDGPVTVAAGGPDVPILVGTRDGEIWELSTSTGPAPTRFWIRLTDGISPAYPG